MNTQSLSDASLAVAITRAASKQTHHTIRYLVDKDRVDDAFRAYAYYRWVDDWLDQDGCSLPERQAFLDRQQSLLESCLHGQPVGDLTPEERLLVDLVRSDEGENSGLQAYLRNMMAVMAFDTNRRGRLISQRELNDYTAWLAIAVTQALHFFIGHSCACPQDATRYEAVTGAHITHMLRDTYEDVQAGYYNFPAEVAAAGNITPMDMDSLPYRTWVKSRVEQARACFKTGRSYLARVENLRCRIAGYAYIRRFEVVLDSIERDRYCLRADYPERKAAGRSVEMIVWALWMALRNRPTAPASSVLSTR